MACLIISVGGLLYSWNDQHYHLEGYTWGLLYSASMVFNSLYVKHAFNQHNELNGDLKSQTFQPSTPKAGIHDRTQGASRQPNTLELKPRPPNAALREISPNNMLKTR